MSDQMVPQRLLSLRNAIDVRIGIPETISSQSPVFSQAWREPPTAPLPSKMSTAAQLASSSWTT
jgi:hypothetical protein